MSTVIPLSKVIFSLIFIILLAGSFYYSRKLRVRAEKYNLELTQLLRNYKATAQALKKSQAQLNAIVNQLPCDLWVFDNNGTCILQNSQASQRWGQQTNSKITQLPLPAPLQSEFIRGQQSASKGKSLEQEVNFPTCDSERVCPTKSLNNSNAFCSFLYKSAPIQSKQKIFGSIAICLDITELKATQAQLIQETSFSQLFMDSLPALFYLWSQDGHLLRWNADLEKVTGYAPNQLSGLHAKTLFNSYDLKRISEKAKLLETKKFTALEANLITRTGQSVPFYFTGAMISFRGQKCILGCGIDISDRKKAQQALSLSEERFKVAFESAPIGMALVTINSQFIQTNAQLSKILGYSKIEFRSLRLDRLEIDNKPTLSQPNDSAPHSKIIQTEKKLAHKDGHTVWVQFSSVLTFDPSNHTQYYVIQIADITERRTLLSKLHRLAFHDTLTGLPNRKLFEEFLNKALAKLTRQKDHSIALIFIDLDRFKRVNDSLGHLAGDHLLKTVAKRLKQQLRPEDTVARFAGDEFVVLLDGIDSTNEAKNLTHRLQTALSVPIMFNDQSLICNASMGICVQSSGDGTAEALLRAADIAMYKAKENGRGQAVIFSNDMHEKAKAELEIENTIRAAIENKSFQLHYQPIISMASGQLVAVEVLSRLPTEPGSDQYIDPGIFLPIASQSGLLSEHDRWVIEESMQQLSQWQSLQPKNAQAVGLHINLSSKHLREVDFVEFISHQLSAANIAPHSIGIEITESALMGNDIRMLKTLKALRKQAISIHLDDFGTGASALSHLYKYSIDSLKIDKSFIHRMLKSEKHLAIVRTMILLAKTQNMRIIAEGISNQQQFDKLISIGCSYGQGFHLSKPLPKADVQALILENRCWIERSHIDQFEPA